MDYKLKYIPNDDTQNKPFCKLQLVVETLNLVNQLFKIHFKSQTMLTQRKKKTFL